MITNNTKLGVAGTETFAVQFANVKHALIAQFDGSATSSGAWICKPRARPPAILPTPFPEWTVPITSPRQVAYSRLLAQNVAGTTDQNDNGTVTFNQAFTGTLSAADTFGRGTLKISGRTSLINYYIVGPEVIRMIQVNPTSALVGSAFGQGTGSFTSASLGTSMLAMEGNPGTSENATLGQLSTSNHSSNPSNFAGVGDDNELGNGVQSAPAASIAGTYTITANGIGIMNVTSANLGSVASLKIYMTDPLLNLNDPK